jgi:hypothetical protein
LEDLEGNEQDSTFAEGNSAVNVGKYMVQVSFTVIGMNANNYTASPFEKVAYLTILRASYQEEMGDLYVEPQWFALGDIESHVLYFSFDLPTGVSPVFALIGETITITQVVKENNAYAVYFQVEQAGEYTYTVSFTHENNNYEQISLKLETKIFIGGEN